MDYAELSELLTGYLPSVTGDAERETLARMLTRASRAIDTRTRRPANAFAPSPEGPAEQTVYGTGAAVLLTPDYVPGSVAEVTAPAGYLPEGWREFRRREASTGTNRVGLHTATAAGLLTPRIPWIKGVPYAVRARWGFLETPGEIVEATLQLVREWWRQQSGEVAGPVGDVNQFRRQERGFPKAVDDLISPYVLEEAEEEREEGTVERGDLLNSDLNPWRDPFDPWGGGGPY